MKGTFYIVSSPSGAGKSSLIKALFEKHNADGSMYLSVSHTTRPPRPGETDHVHYHFVDEAEFKRLIARGAFYEWAEVFGKYYGTSRELARQALEDGRDVFLDIDWQGARQIREQEPGARSIFILPPSLAELRRRLVARAQDSAEVIDGRMSRAQREISHYREYDYCLINDDFAATLENFWTIVRANRLSRTYFDDNYPGVAADLLAGYREDA